MPYLLLVENDTVLAGLMQEWLGDEGVEADIADGYESALQALARRQVDLVVTDTIDAVPPFGARQVESLRRFIQAAGAVPVLLFTGYAEARTIDAGAVGLAGVCFKPDMNELLSASRPISITAAMPARTLKVRLVQCVSQPLVGACTRTNAFIPFPTLRTSPPPAALLACTYDGRQLPPAAGKKGKAK
jgi:CheY-like chemotaxis protein